MGPNTACNRTGDRESLRLIGGGMIVCLAFVLFCIMIDPVWDSISGKNRRFAKAMAKYQEEMADYQEQYAYWQHLYICMRCGHKYYLE